MSVAPDGAALLTQAEVASFTNRSRYKAQARVLAGLGVPFKPHPVDDYLLVSRAAALRIFGGPQAANDDRAGAGFETNVAALRAHGKKANARRS